MISKFALMRQRLKANNRLSTDRVRLHQFPPLPDKVSALSINESGDVIFDAREYQQKLTEGFQQGLDQGIEQGFKQGLQEGKEEGLQQGHKQGYDEGYQKGLLTGEASGKASFNRAAKPFDKWIKKIETYLQQYKKQRRDELLQLVDKVTRQVIRCELALQPTQLLALVDEALSALPEEPKSIKVLLNPEEFKRIHDVEPEQVKKWSLAPAQEMALGECRIITESSEMDIGCQHRLDQCIDVLKENLL